MQMYTVLVPQKGARQDPFPGTSINPSFPPFVRNSAHLCPTLGFLARVVVLMVIGISLPVIMPKVGTAAQCSLM